MQGSWQTENDFISRASINSVCKTLIQVRSHSDVLGGCALRGTLFNPAKPPRGNAEAGKTDSPETKRERLQDWATEDACSMYTTDSKASRSDPQKRRKCLSRGQRNQERVVSEAHKGDGLKQMRRDPQRREGGRLVFNGEKVSFLWWKGFWRQMVARGAPQDERMWCHWNVHFETLKMVNVMHIFPQQKKNTVNERESLPSFQMPWVFTFSCHTSFISSRTRGYSTCLEVALFLPSHLNPEDRNLTFRLLCIFRTALSCGSF